MTVTTITTERKTNLLSLYLGLKSVFGSTTAINKLEAHIRECYPNDAKEYIREMEMIIKTQ